MSPRQPPLPGFFRAGALLLFVLAVLDVTNIAVRWSFPYLNHLSVVWLVALIGGCLLWQGRAAVAGIIAYLAATGIGSLLGLILALSLILPPKLIHAAWHSGAFFSRWDAVYWGASYAILITLFFFTTSNSAQATLRSTGFNARSGWLRPKAFVGYATILTFLLGLAIGTMLRQFQLPEAIAIARKQCGHDYDYFVTNFQVIWRNGHGTGSATVLAYNENEVRTVPVRWENTPPVNP